MSDKKTNIIKLLDERGTKVKITTIRDWTPLFKMSGEEVPLIWIINHTLAVRRLVGIFITLFILGAGISCFFLCDIGPVFLYDMFMGVGIVLSIVSAVLTFMSDNWVKQLAGYRTFSKFHNLPSFGVFGYIMYYIARIIAFVFYVVWFIVIILIQIVAKSSDGFITPYNKLGLPTYSDYDEIIEQGTAYEKSVQAASSALLAKFGAEVDHSLAEQQIEIEYNAIKKSIEDVNHKIDEIDQTDSELTDEEKIELEMLKAEALKSRQLLDEKYSSESDYEGVKSAFEAIDKKLGKMISDDYLLSESEKVKLNSMKEKNDTAQQKLENSYSAKKDALQHEHDETIANINRQYCIDINTEDK